MLEGGHKVVTQKCMRYSRDRSGSFQSGKCIIKNPLHHRKFCYDVKQKQLLVSHLKALQVKSPPIALQPPIYDTLYIAPQLPAVTEGSAQSEAACSLVLQACTPVQTIVCICACKHNCTSSHELSLLFSTTSGLAHDRARLGGRVPAHQVPGHG